MAKLRDILLDVRRSAADLLRGAPRGLGRRAGEAFAPFEAGGVVVQCHARWPTDGALIASWEALSLAAPNGTAMHSPAWQAATFFASGATHLRLITVHGPELLAVVPMQLSPAGGLGTIGHWMVDYLDQLVKADAGPRVWPAVLQFLAAQWDRRVTEVVFHNVRELADVRRDLPAVAAVHGFTCEESVIDQAPAIALPATWDDYLRSLDAHERKETRRKLKKAEEKGAATLKRAGFDDAAAALEVALAFMESAGGEKGRGIRQFLRPLLTAAGPPLIAAGRMAVLTLEIAGKPAASLLQFPTVRGPMLYNAGHDPALREWSPGAVALAMSIREAIGRGEKTYDLLRGAEPYKYRAGAKDRALYRITLRRSGRQ